MAQISPNDVTFHQLEPKTDFEFALGIFQKCADYVDLESGEKPGPAHVNEFFVGRPPHLSQNDKLLVGISNAHGAGIGLIEILKGHPSITDWYIGLLMIDPEYRKHGLGKAALNWVLDAARKTAVTRLLLCVLKDNPRAHAFWVREGFVMKQETPPEVFGQKTHIRFELVRHIT